MPETRDWKLKQEVLRLLFEVHQVNEVVDAVIGVTHDKYVKVYDQYSQRWKKHEASSEYGWFFEEISTQLKCTEGVPGDSLMHGSITDFIKALPSQNKKRLKEAVGNIIGVNHYDELKLVLEATKDVDPLQSKQAADPVHSYTQHAKSVLYHEEHEHYFPLWTPYKDVVGNIVHGLKERNIDQSLYYQTTGSVTRWFRITNSDYDLYDSCKLSLARLVKSKVWESFVSQEQYYGNVMLGGGGAPSKDMVLIKSVLRLKKVKQDDGSRIHHTLLDTSHFMLGASRRQITDHLRAEGWGRNVNLRTVQCDILDMRGTRALLHPRAKNVAWFLTGGTLGNLDEHKFFAAVAKKATRGDLLIVGLACHDDDPDQQFLENLEKEYRQDSVRDFMVNPLRAIWSELDLPGTTQDAWNSLTVNAVTGADNKISKVPNSVTVAVSINLPIYDTVRLLQSTRYRADDLIKFAKLYEWEAVNGAVFDGSDANFKQIVFKHL